MIRGWIEYFARIENNDRTIRTGGELFHVIHVRVVDERALARQDEVRCERIVRRNYRRESL